LFMTIHKSKGLENNTIFILHPELLPHPAATQEWQMQQESNLKYVAITRAIENLIWVKY
jgi:DNA helicase-2/ATP-dependent DNA helicase PcrA